MNPPTDIMLPGEAPKRDTRDTPFKDMMNHARQNILPKLVERPGGRAVLAPVERFHGKYLVICTESGYVEDAGKYSLTFTVEPFGSFRVLPPSVILQDPQGRAAQLRYDCPGGLTRWATFVHHLPGRKIRAYGSVRIEGTQRWEDIPAMTRRIVMTDKAPWFRDVSFDEFRKLPTVDGQTL